MSALEFLSVAGATDGAVAVSAIARAQRDLGATFVERDGWSVPVSLPNEKEHLKAVGVADLSHLSKLEVRTLQQLPGGGTDNVLMISGAPDFVTYRISNRRTLTIGARAAIEAFRSTVDRQLVLDVTAAHSIIALVGPEAETVLRRMTHIHHFPSGGEIAHVQGHVLERPNGYWIICAQEYGQYVWEVAVDRASALGGGPVGVDAL